MYKMTYSQTVQYLFSQLPVFQSVGSSAYKEGLATTQALDHYLGHPHRAFRSIHVAGTNGKGSTSHTLAAVLQSQGYRVGLYTSPHLLDFRERIRVNGEMIEEQAVVDFVHRHRSFFEPLQPSFFELTTLLAFHYFAEQKVDFAVIEVGLGGRLDCTNIISPLLSVITNISPDHTQFLGSEPEQIAAEKAGIIKPGVPVVVGEESGVRHVFRQKADAVQSPIVFAEDFPKVLGHSIENGKMVYRTTTLPNLMGELTGLPQAKNTNTVLTAIEQLQALGVEISELAIRNGFANVMKITGLMGRWQVLQTSPHVIADTGHNKAGIGYVVQQLAKEHFVRLHFVLGMVSDKDVSGVLALLPQDAVYYFTKANIPRALPENELQTLAQNFGLQGQCFANVGQAVQAALLQAQPHDLVFVGGSNFVVAEALPLFPCSVKQ